MKKVLLIVCILLLVVNVIGYVIFTTSEVPVSLRTLLDRMQNAPTIEFTLDDSLTLLKITADWGIFNGLRDFINVLGGVLGFVIWLVTQLINMLVAIGYLLYVLGFTSLQNIGIVG